MKKKENKRKGRKIEKKTEINGKKENIKKK